MLGKRKSTTSSAKSNYTVFDQIISPTNDKRERKEKKRGRGMLIKIEERSVG